MLILDGVSDRPINGKTPLSEAYTPNLDKLAELGINGIMDTIAPGIRPGSDTAHLALLGYDPFKFYCGRGPIEAAGAGIEVKTGDVAFRVNFATVKGEGSIFEKIVIDRRAGRINDTDELVKAINEEVKIDSEFIFKRGSGHRGALVLRGDDLSDKVTDTDPKKIGERVKKCIALEKGAERTAEIVNDFMQKSHEVLERHPFNIKREREGLLKANALLLRGVGKLFSLPKFEERYGMSLAVISGTILIKGVGRIVGGELIEDSRITGGKDTDLNAKVDLALKALKSYDFVLLHIKACDEYGHDGDFDGKRKFIEKIDKALERILSLDFSEICVVISADHTTPVSVRDHTADPVPLSIVFDQVRKDDVKRYSEFDAYKGGLCRIRGIDLMNIILDLIDKAKKYGA